MSTTRYRRRGRGGIYKYATNAGVRWRFQLYEPIDLENPNEGMRRVSKGGFRSQTEADDALRAALTNLKNRVRAAGAGGQTFAAYASDWLAGLDLAPSTMSGYRRLVRLYLEPTLADAKLTAITPSRIGRLYKDLAQHGGHGGNPISANTIRKAHVVLGSILDAAVDDGLLALNPARRARIVKAPTGKQVRAQAEELVTWSLPQLKTFLDWNRDEYHDGDHALWLVLAMTGMRRGEALALRWSDLDLVRKRIAIRRAADSIEIGTTKLPKNGKPRVVDVDDDVLSALKGWKATRGAISLDLARPDAYLFGDAAGLLINPNRVTNRWTARIRAFQKAHGDVDLPGLPLHGLRHSHATILLQAGVHPRVVQERLGHSTITITMEIYSHVTDTMQRDATDRLSILFRRA